MREVNDVAYLPEYTDHMRLAAPTLTRKCSENDTWQGFDSMSKVVDILLDSNFDCAPLDALKVISHGPLVKK